MITQALNQFSKWFLHHQTFSGYVEPIMQVFKPAWRSGMFRAQVTDTKVYDGGFLSVKLKPSKQWPSHVAGQHISLTVEINGRLLTRVFTIASSVKQYKKSGLVRLFIKTNPQGRFTGQLGDALTAGLWCNISAPGGDFIFKNTPDPVTFIAGGSGITPMIAMLDEHLEHRSQPVSLVYYAKAGEHVLDDELSKLASRFQHFSYLLLTRDKSCDITANINTASNPTIYCCGPNGFMETVSDFAQQHNLAYFEESFGLQLPRLNDDSQFNVQFNNSQHVVSASDVLLNQFEAKKLPVKRGCGIGICHQCQCIKKSGVVRNLKTGELSDNGEQLIQLCVSQPMSDLELQV